MPSADAMCSLRWQNGRSKEFRFDCRATQASQSEVRTLVLRPYSYSSARGAPEAPTKRVMMWPTFPAPRELKRLVRLCVVVAWCTRAFTKS